MPNNQDKVKLWINLSMPRYAGLTLVSVARL